MKEPEQPAAGEPPQGPVGSPGPIPSDSERKVLTFAPLDRRMHSLFIGPAGLHPLWRLALYLLIYKALQLGLRFFIFSDFPDVARIWLQTAAEFGLAVVALLPAWLMARMERRPFGCYGLPLRQAFGGLFWSGVLWGLVALSLLLLALRLAGALEIGSLALHGVRVLKFALFWGAFFLVVGFYEEFLVRGYTQFTLTQMLGFWPSAMVLSAAFGLLHLGNPGETWIGILGAIAIGFFFCLTLRRTGNLWFAVGFHASWDWGESYLYSVPDSGGVAPGHLLQTSLHGSAWLTGGTVGPEGSVFLYLLLAVLWVVFNRVYPAVRYPQENTKGPDRSKDPGLKTPKDIAGYQE